MLDKQGYHQNVHRIQHLLSYVHCLRGKMAKQKALWLETCLMPMQSRHNISLDQVQCFHRQLIAWYEWMDKVYGKEDVLSQTCYQAGVLLVESAKYFLENNKSGLAVNSQE